MQARSAAFRFGILAVLLLGWWWVRSVHPRWIPAVKAWVISRPFITDRTAAITAASVLAIFFALLMWGRFSPWRRRSADGAMGEGCVVFAAYGVAALGVLLAIGWWFHIRAIIWFVALISVLPAVQIALGAVYEGFKSLRKKWERRERKPGARELEQMLAGRTHVIPRNTAEDPARRWLELRYYAPDGRMVGYKAEQDGRITAYPGQVTWRIEDGRLVTVSSLEPDKPFRYTLTLGYTGQFSYLQYEPGSKLHGLVVFRTVEVREGEPSVTTAATHM
jgi:hypothetical protein